jgi:hypothetical protein
VDSPATNAVLKAISDLATAGIAALGRGRDSNSDMREAMNKFDAIIQATTGLDLAMFENGNPEVRAEEGEVTSMEIILWEGWVQAEHTGMAPSEMHHLKIYRDGDHYLPVIARETLTNEKGSVWVPVTGISTAPVPRE